MNFLATLHQQSYQYNSINSYRSAISSVHVKIHGYSIVQHPTVTRLLKGIIFYDRPPLLRYTSMHMECGIGTAIHQGAGIKP